MEKCKLNLSTMFLTCWRTFGRNEISIWFWGWKKVQSTLFLHKSNESQATSLVYTIRPHLSRSGTLPAHELKLRHHQAILRVNFYFVCSVQNSKRREVPEFEKFPKFPFRHSRKELSVVSSGGRAYKIERADESYSKAWKKSLRREEKRWKGTMERD